MSSNSHRSTSRWNFWKEALVTTPVQWLPFTLGRALRRLVYRTIFEQIGPSAQIYPGVQFSHAKGIEIGTGARIQSGVRLKNFSQNSQIRIAERAYLDRGVDIKTYQGGTIEIGTSTFIGPYVCMAGESIRVGTDCLIASHGGIYAMKHNFANISHKIKEQGVSCQGVVIEDDCWLGTGVRVTDGVTIGRGSVVGAGAVVTKSIPPYSIAVGVPARVIGSRNSSNPVSSSPRSTTKDDNWSARSA